MSVRSTFPHPVEEIENLEIPMADGVHLAARVFMPTDAKSRPVPAIIECNPYRKREGLIHRDTLAYPYLAGHGYACMRIDLRGSGESGGVIDDEYSERELRDLYDAIEWIAKQPWCTGKVGMTGKSWSGFNALQVAAMQPPSLKAIIPVHASADRYADDVHYMGGTVLHDNFAWASIMYALQALPPDPVLVGNRWRTMWQQRLDGMEFWLKRWAEHQQRDAYWKRASVCEDYARIRCPILGVGGWEDGYSNTVPMLIEGCRDVPVHGLVGPWGHNFPFNALPGPQIGYLQYCLRWWDRWLKDKDTGIDREPAYRVWMNDSFRPDPTSDERAGRWIAEDRWPSPRVAMKSWHCGNGGLADQPTGPWQRAIRSESHTGITNLEWCAHGDGSPDMPADQRPDDARSLTFDTEPLVAPVTMLGAPVATLVFSSDKPLANVAVRLCDVWPDGTSSRVTFMLFNLTHRDGHAKPAPLEPGKRYTVRIALNHVAHRFLTGQRIRLAVSTQWWPMMWPSPEDATITLHEGSRLDLPLRPDRPEDTQWADFGSPETAPPIPSETVREHKVEHIVTRDIGKGTTTARMIKDAGSNYLPTVDILTDQEIEQTYTIADGDPLSMTAEARETQMLSREGWEIEIRTRTTMTCSAKAFHVTAELDAFENGTRVHSRDESFTIPRDLN